VDVGWPHSVRVKIYKSYDRVSEIKIWRLVVDWAFELQIREIGEGRKCKTEGGGVKIELFPLSGPVKLKVWPAREFPPRLKSEPIKFQSIISDAVRGPNAPSVVMEPPMAKPSPDDKGVVDVCGSNSDTA
jgi:hypothetical protein